MLTDLRAAFSLLTRLPIGLDAQPDLARCVWAFPIAGIVVNGAGCAVFWVASAFGMPSLLAAAWTLAATMLLTGALHEDGLSDTADGFGGGATKCRKLAIMRDSRIGSYGAAALVVSSLIRAAAVAATAQPIPALIAAGALGRSGMVVLLLLLSPARGDGMGASVHRPAIGNAAAGLGTGGNHDAAACAGQNRPDRGLFGSGREPLPHQAARGQIGGHTGDVLGAAEIITECVVLTVFASGGTA